MPVAAGNRAQLFLAWARKSPSGRTSYVAELPNCRRKTAANRRSRYGAAPRAIQRRCCCAPPTDSQRVNALMQAVPPDYREVPLLREVEELSYQEIAGITGVHMGYEVARRLPARDTYGHAA